ncbi:MAG TPA: Imm1 family immunity protein [Actinoplanes sp.]|jgi:hypothetical protein
MTRRIQGDTLVPQPVLVDGQGYRAEPSTEDELIRELRRIDADARARHQPLVATIYADSDADDPSLLSIGLGADDSVLVYSSGHANDDEGFSAGPRTDDTTEVTFRYGSGHSEYLGWMLIAAPDAYAAAAEFYHTGQRPTNVRWAQL